MHDLPSIQVVAEMPCNGAGRVLGYKTLLVWKLTALSGSVYALLGVGNALEGSLRHEEKAMCLRLSIKTDT